MTSNSDPPGRPRRRVYALVVIAAAIVLAIAATVYFGVREDNSTDSTSTAPAPTATEPSGRPTALPTTTPTGPITSTSATPAPGQFAYQPLWPFADAADAATWQQSYRDGGHQPWHLDPATVALNFTQTYLGYSDIDRVLLTNTKAEQSWVTVGFNLPNGVASPAAVLHLVRISTGDDAPWEVVGTEDRTLTFTAPRYGTLVTSPLPVGGHVTGVDESLRVRVHQLGHDQPVGEIPGIPAGGEQSPWSGSVPFAASCPGTLTVAVSTGGHTAEVERFAITGVHC
ncbi:hypothetical protein AB0N05_27825 [Nocardia sp. NPDC051030]|uniref:hypothetical protein n=1 Tax=Nocardia sp. NPDC051030 TaxID=3155162 RepID=UPI00343193B3